MLTSMLLQSKRPPVGGGQILWILAAALVLLFTFAGLASGQCPWPRSPLHASLHSDCVCGYSNVRRLSVQCSPVANFSQLLEMLNSPSVQRLPIDLLYINNATGLTSLPRNSFKNLDIQQIHLANTRLESIEKGAFAGLEDRLSSLTLQNTGLKEVPVSELRTLRALRSLDLSNNRLRRIRTATFRELGRLSTLRLAFNHDLQLERDAFIGIDRSLKNLNLKSTGQKVIPDCIRNLTELAFLDLAQNRIEEIEPKVFKNLDSLTALSLERNLIRSLHPNTFLGLNDSLSSLSLLNNLLVEFPQAALSKLSGLRVLDLGFNAIRQLPFNAFHSNELLTLLALDGNPIRTLPLEAFQHLNTTLRGISVGGKQFECDCRVRWLSEWSTEYSLQITSRERNPQFCAKPKHLRNKPFIHIDLDDFVCPAHMMPQPQPPPKPLLPQRTVHHNNPIMRDHGHRIITAAPTTSTTTTTTTTTRIPTTTTLRSTTTTSTIHPITTTTARTTTTQQRAPQPVFVSDIESPPSPLLPLSPPTTTTSTQHSISTLRSKNNRRPLIHPPTQPVTSVIRVYEQQQPQSPTQSSSSSTSGSSGSTSFRPPITTTTTTENIETVTKPKIRTSSEIIPLDDSEIDELHLLNPEPKLSRQLNRLHPPPPPSPPLSSVSPIGITIATPTTSPVPNNGNSLNQNSRQPNHHHHHSHSFNNHQSHLPTQQQASLKLLDAVYRNNSISLRWEPLNHNSNTNGYQVVYRYFGSKEFHKSDHVSGQVTSHTLTHYISPNELVVVCVLTIDDSLAVFGDKGESAIPIGQCRELSTRETLIKKPTGGHRSLAGGSVGSGPSTSLSSFYPSLNRLNDIDKIVIGISAAVCLFIIIAVIVFSCCFYRSTSKDSPLRTLVTNAACMSSKSISPITKSSRNESEWENISVYSSRSIPRARLPGITHTLQHPTMLSRNTLRSHLSVPHEFNGPIYAGTQQPIGRYFGSTLPHKMSGRSPWLESYLQHYPSAHHLPAISYGTTVTATGGGNGNLGYISDANYQRNAYSLGRPRSSEEGKLSPLGPRPRPPTSAKPHRNHRSRSKSSSKSRSKSSKSSSSLLLNHSDLRSMRGTSHHHHPNNHHQHQRDNNNSGGSNGGSSSIHHRLLLSSSSNSYHSSQNEYDSDWNNPTNTTTATTNNNSPNNSTNSSSRNNAGTTTTTHTIGTSPHNPNITTITTFGGSNYRLHSPPNNRIQTENELDIYVDQNYAKRFALQ